MINKEIYKERIENPITGETIYVLESNEDVFRIEFVIEPNSEIAAEHIHPSQEQTIHVIEGSLGCRVDGQTRFLGVGESAIIPAGSTHFQWNPTDQYARAIEEIRPAGKAHSFFRVLFALVRDGRTNTKGIPKPLIGAAFADEFKDFVVAKSLGLRIMFRLLGPISKRLGYRELINDYIRNFEHDDIEQTPVCETYIANPEYSTRVGSLATEKR